MTDEKTLRIEKELQKSSRWRANQQPALDVVLEYLTEHGWPVEHVWMVKDDEMIVALSRMLTIAEAVELGKWLQPDEFGMHGFTCRLWWD